VVVDPAGQELLKGRQPGYGQQQGNDRRIAAGETPRRRDHAEQGWHEPEHGPYRAHQPLGRCGIGEDIEEEKEAGEPRIDQARPVRLVAERWSEPRLVQVEPTLAVEKMANLHEPHGVVHIAERFAGIGPGADDQVGCDEQECEPDQDCKMRLPNLARHRQRLSAMSCEGAALRQDH